MSALRSKASVSVRAQLAGWLWEVLEEVTAEERALFLQFVWGRSRMPPSSDERDPNPESRFKVDELYRSSPDESFMTASTCFFCLHLPRYTSKAVLKEKLRYAIYNCKDMDLG